MENCPLQVLNTDLLKTAAILLLVLVETASIIECHQIILKQEITIMFQMLSKNHSNKEKATQENLLITEISYARVYSRGKFRRSSLHSHTGLLTISEATDINALSELPSLDCCIM